ncbi:TMF-regulated nuclear protein 1 [Rhinatrema bivittatum]|uniref:TMF-regulated nuclear protein 1 n=1 Tax=Rhinatrema bivittatum TaxID=194408 RepID=UPI001127C480|nr:TMF-regulated nuclear protein 1 [Rhinatrema bivittatum]
MPGSGRRRMPRVSAGSLRKVFPSAGLPDPARRELKPEPAAAPSAAAELPPPPGPGPRPRAAAQRLELAEARRRLLEVEGQQRLLCELESGVQQLHRFFLQAQLQAAGRGEGLGRLGGGVAQAQVHVAAHGQRLKKGLRRHRKPPRILASALGLGGCVPWGGRRGRRRSASAEPAPAERLPRPASPRSRLRP